MNWQCVRKQLRRRKCCHAIAMCSSLSSSPVERLTDCVEACGGTPNCRAIYSALWERGKRAHCAFGETHLAADEDAHTCDFRVRSAAPSSACASSRRTGGAAGASDEATRARTSARARDACEQGCGKRAR